MDKEKLKKAITKALGYAENDGKPDINNLKKGKTGEMKSIFQFTPDTWKLYSKQVSGHDNVPLTPDTESLVVQKKVSDWVDNGYTPEQIASMWNAGEQKPDAYKENWKGTNKKYGIAYDTPAYAKKVTDYTNQFMNENGDQTPETLGSKTGINIDPIISLMKQAKAPDTITPQKQNTGLLNILASQKS